LRLIKKQGAEVDSRTRHLSNQRIYLRIEQAKVIIQGSSIPYKPMRDAKHAEAENLLQ